MALAVGSVCLWMAAYTADELLGIETGRVDGGINKYLHQRSHNFITRQFYVKYWFAVVNLGKGNLFALLVGITLLLCNMVDEAPLESTGKYFVLMLDESLDAFVLQSADNAGSHINHLFVFISYPFVDYSLLYPALGVLIKES